VASFGKSLWFAETAYSFPVPKERMLLAISATHTPATDLGYLLHKHPDRFQSFDLSFGKAHVFYPEVGESRATATLLLDVDPVGMVRGKGKNQSFLLSHYVNDRPYVASSFMSVAISQVFSPAMAVHRTTSRNRFTDQSLRFFQRGLGAAIIETRFPLHPDSAQWPSLSNNS
jgi:hypothetical protein